MTVGASTSSLPEVLAGRYRVLGAVGRGAIAEVVRARDEQTGGEVALKILYPHLRESAAVVERFRREVEIVRRIAHPNVLAIHEVADSDGQLFLVMDYHPGGDLADRIARKGRFQATELRLLAAQLCGALAAAHRAGVVHRDVKPSNVLCGRGSQLDVRLCDFGLARTAELSGLTTANAVLGTPEYMAPEVVTDGHADPRSDIYSLGIVLFEAATGRLPFYSDSPYQLMRQHVDVEAPRARSLVPELPPAIDEAIARALAKDPLDRFATCEDLAGALAADGPVAETALAPIAARAAARRACRHCGGWVVDVAGVCADCGVAMLRLEHERGGVDVLVTGPGNIGDKIYAVWHVALFNLLDELPPGSVPTERGRRRAPRIPFYVARGISERSGGELVRRLEAIGFQARVVTDRPLAQREVRRKAWEMTKRHTVGTGILLGLLPQLREVFERMGAPHWWFFLSYPLLLSAYGVVLGLVTVRNARPIVGRRKPGVQAADASRRLADTLARLASRQDRRLVARILQRLERIEQAGRRELAVTLAGRAVLAVDALATLDELRDADASVTREPQGALATLRREEMTRVVLRADLLRVASRLDGICLVLARAGAVDSAEAGERVEEEIQELARAIESEQETNDVLRSRP